MRVVVLQYMFQNDGSTNALLELLKVLSAKGFEFLVIYSRRSVHVEQLKHIGVKSVRIPYLASSDRGYRGIIRLIYIALCVFVNVMALSGMLLVSLFYKPHMIHTNVSPIHLGYYLARILRKPHLWHLREYRWKDGPVQPVLSYSYFISLLKSSDTIATTRALKEYYGLDRCKVIYDGVIEAGRIRTCIPLADRRDSFLFVGRVERSKGVEILIDAFARFAKENKNWHLDIVGGYSDDYFSELKRKIRTSGIEDRVCFWGICDDVAVRMRERKVVVISSLSEGFGYVTVEAMNNMCFVIANDNTGTKEQLDNAREIAGHDVAYRFVDSDGLLDQMRRFVTGNQERHQCMVDEAYRIVNTLYGVEVYGASVAAYYEELIKK